MVIPRFSDLHCIHQTAKFELSELEDNFGNRKRVLDSIISQAVKKISTIHLSNIPIASISQLKLEFSGDKTFLVSQDLPGSNVNYVNSYSLQIEKFPVLKQTVEVMSRKILKEQKRFEDDANRRGIQVDHISTAKKIDPEFLASVTELVLEGLRFIEPPLIDRKDGLYASSNN